MFHCFSSACPVECHVQSDARDFGGRLGLSRTDRDVKEAHFTQAVLFQNTSPVAIDGQPDIPCFDIGQIDGRIMSIVC